MSTLNLLSRAILGTLALPTILMAAGVEPAEYVTTRTVLLGAPDRWDYLTFDVESHRV